MDRTIPELTDAIASGDPEAFAHLYRAKFDMMYRHARYATGRDESFCLDVVQDAMLRVVKSMRPLETIGQLEGWLRTLVKSAAIDRLRSESRRRRREEVASTLPRPERVDDTDERLQWLQRQLAALDDEQVALLEGRYRFGRTLRQLGTAMGLSTGAVDGRIGRVVSTIRERAREQFNE
ncbi:MAG: RNA polymerase sigma factor [Planctomycetota bacterium]